MNVKNTVCNLELQIKIVNLLPMEKTEAKIQQEIFVWHWNNYPAERGLLWHNNNNSRNAVDGARKKAIGVVAGVADLTFVHRGRVYFIEVKTPKGRQSKAQKEWQASIIGAGCEYHIVRSLLDFQHLYADITKKPLSKGAKKQS